MNRVRQWHAPALFALSGILAAIALRDEPHFFVQLCVLWVGQLIAVFLMLLLGVSPFRAGSFVVTLFMMASVWRLVQIDATPPFVLYGAGAPPALLATLLVEGYERWTARRKASSRPESPIEKTSA